MSIWDDLRSWDSLVSERINVQKRFPGYFNKWIFRAALLVMALIIFFAGQSVHWRSGMYIECTSSTPCFNPSYNETCALGTPCSLQVMQPGDVIGEKPSWLVSNAGLLVLLDFALAFGLNHLVFEVKKKWSK